MEYTGGSTGSALAFVSAALGLEFCAVFSDAFSKSKQHMMEAFGGDVIVEKSFGKGITPELIQRMKKRVSSLSQKQNSFYADQFGSPDVTKGYEPMGNEITKQLGDKIDILCAFSRNRWPIMGDWKGLRKDIQKIKLVAFERL